MALDNLKYHPSDRNLDRLPTGLIQKGTISSDSDFPLKINVRNKWYYEVTASVCDCVPGNTFTGQSFIKGDHIYWASNNWILLGNNEQEITGPTGPTGPTGITGDAMLEGYIELGFTAVLDPLGWKDDGDGNYSITFVDSGASGNGQQNHNLGSTDKIRPFVFYDDGTSNDEANDGVIIKIYSNGNVVLRASEIFAGKINLISTL